MIQFLLNNQLVSEDALDPNLTVLNYLRTRQQRPGTKEGCASGDCGACSVTLGKAVGGTMQYETVNSCLTLVSALQGKQLITVEDLRHGRALHPAQQAMVDCHGSQCGFCTPGFVMSLFSLQKPLRAGIAIRRKLRWRATSAAVPVTGRLWPPPNSSARSR